MLKFHSIHFIVSCVFPTTCNLMMDALLIFKHTAMRCLILNGLTCNDVTETFTQLNQDDLF